MIVDCVVPVARVYQIIAVLMSAVIAYAVVAVARIYRRVYGVVVKRIVAAQCINRYTRDHVGIVVVAFGQRDEQRIIFAVNVDSR